RSPHASPHENKTKGLVMDAVDADEATLAPNGAGPNEFPEGAAAVLNALAADAGPSPGEKIDALQPTIRVIPGRIHQIATDAEAALIEAGAPFYSRGGQLVRPIVEEVTATRGFKTLVTRARPVSPDCMVDHMSRAAQFRRYDARSKKFVRVDPPHV